MKLYTRRSRTASRGGAETLSATGKIAYLSGHDFAHPVVAFQFVTHLKIHKYYYDTYDTSVFAVAYVVYV